MHYLQSGPQKQGHNSGTPRPPPLGRFRNSFSLKTSPRMRTRRRKDRGPAGSRWTSSSSLRTPRGLTRIFHTQHSGRDAALRRPRAVQARNVRPSAWAHRAGDNARCSAAARGGDGAAHRPYLSLRVWPFPSGRVEMWRGEPKTLPFPHPAHQTGRAVFPHPAFGQGAHAFAHGRFAVNFSRRSRPSFSSRYSSG